MNGIAAAPFMGGGASGSPAPVGRGGGEAPQRPLAGPGTASVAQAQPNNAINPNTLRQLGVPDQYLDRPQMWVNGQLRRADMISR
jgi:hypothetical protein